MCPSKNYPTYNHNFGVQTKLILTAKTDPKFLRTDQFLRDLQPKQIFIQTNFKLSHGNEINIDT